MIVVRNMDPVADRPGVEAIDTAFETTSVFELQITPRRIDLVERRLEAPLLKRGTGVRRLSHGGELDRA